MYDILSPAAIQKRGFFKLDYVEQLLREHDAGFEDHSLLLWGLISIELWHRIFIDAQSHPKSNVDSMAAAYTVGMH